ncbi:hypothetical protein Tco_0381178 [Tanacetum coccineum]
MAAPTIPVFAEEKLGDPIDIKMDIIHPEPVAIVAFPAAAVVRTQAQHGEAIRGIHEHLLGVPIQEELTALRFRVDIAEAENASLRARIKTTKEIEKITRNRERQARIKIEQQLAAVQESQHQDREDFRKLKELVIALLCAPTVIPPNKNKIDFRISLDESDDEDYTDSENDEILKPSSSKPTVDYLDDLDYFDDFENEFPAIVYNDGLTSKPDLEIEPLFKRECPLCKPKFTSLFVEIDVESVTYRTLHLSKDVTGPTINVGGFRFRTRAQRRYNF